MQSGFSFHFERLQDAARLKRETAQKKHKQAKQTFEWLVGHLLRRLPLASAMSPRIATNCRTWEMFPRAPLVDIM